MAKSISVNHGKTGEDDRNGKKCLSDIESYFSSTNEDMSRVLDKLDSILKLIMPK